MDIDASLTSGGGLYSTEVSADDAWAGAFVTTFAPAAGHVRVGQATSMDGSTFDVWQGFMEFDLTGVDEVGTALLSMWVGTVHGGEPYTVLAAPYDYGGGPVTVGAWRDRAELAGLAVGASLVPVVQGAYATFSGDLSALLVPGQVNRLVLFTDRNRDGIAAPSGALPWSDLSRSDPAHPARLTIAPPAVVAPGASYITVAELRHATGAGVSAEQDDRLALCCILASRHVDEVIGNPTTYDALTPPYTIELVPCPPAWRLAALAAGVRFTKSPDLPFGAVGGLGDMAVYVRGTSIPEVDLILTGHRKSWGVA